ncbi:hypothetical protein BDK61_1459 [Haloarcula quadrata]|uniref:Uncharacterized protein n=1 Tax=Haloarcula quadrata TaxID=182779 RepID=A0A495R4M7_9EURY|nr:hypothetical protein [Haloarcula quadrata]RKS82160.1 hypothetical protein BDK61_1459 [Haloarcula quadrata]
MADEDYRLNADLDDEYEKKFEILKDEYGHGEGRGSVKPTVYDIIDEAFDAHDLDLDDADTSDDSDEEKAYDPFDAESRPDSGLDREQLKNILADYEQPALHPKDVSREILPKYVSTKKDVVAAVARYLVLDYHGDPNRVPTEDETSKAVRIVGLDGDHRTKKKYEQVRNRFKREDGVGRADNVDPAHILGVDSVDAWVEETKREFLADDAKDHHVTVLESRREEAADLFQWVAPHEDVRKCLNELDIAIEEAKEDEEGGDEDESDDEENAVEDEPATEDGDDTTDDGDESGEKLDEMEKIEMAEETDDEDEDENQPADRSETEKKREAIKRKGGDPTAKK